jgi:hypothetical protein
MNKHLGKIVARDEISWAISNVKNIINITFSHKSPIVQCSSG